MKKAFVIAAGLILIFIMGCISQPPPAPAGLEQYIPAKDLPKNFRLVGIRNNTSLAELVNGKLDVKVLGAARGDYSIESAPVDGYVLIVKCASATHASNATKNFMALFSEFPTNAPFVRFSNVSFNGHSATKILDFYPDSNAKEFYKYIWQKEELVFIVSGSDDQQASLKLAQLTGA